MLDIVTIISWSVQHVGTVVTMTNEHDGKGQVVSSWERKLVFFFVI